MFITNKTVFGGRGFSVGGGGGVLKTATGAPPITLEKTLAKSPENITVYGNTGGVGDRTGNLLPAMTIGKKLSPNSGNESTDTTSAVSPFIPVDFDQYSTYTFSGLVDDLYSFVAAYDSEMKFVGRTGAAGVKTRQCTVQNFTGGTPASSDKIAYIRLTQYEQGSASGKIDLIASAKIMLNTGNTAHGYEPYGFRIPILIGAVPAGYTQLEYIEATGTQYIDTGVVPTVNTQADYKVRFAEGATDSSPLISARTGSSSNNRFIPIAYTSPSVNYRTSLGSVNLVSDEEINFSIDYTGSFQPQNNVSIINGVSFELTGHGYTKSKNYNLYLFATSGYGSNLYLSKGRMYYCQIYDNGILVRNFVPAKRNSDDIVGMYDIVNGVFYTNADSSGDNFIAGAEMPLKIINLYSDRSLTASVIRLFVYPKTKEAKVLNQDISALQDWEQDWKLPKADSLTVSAGTTVEPSSMEIKYYGKR